MADYEDGTEEAAEGEDRVEALDLEADERKLVTQPYDYSVDQLVSHVEKEKILLIEVPYQREYVWDDAKASRLLESLLLNVPIPVCYFAENEDGTWEVIDGLQRAHSIVRFLGNAFKLRGLSVLTELNGKRFSDLPARDQRRIESRTLRFVVITDDSHPDIKFDVFERLNTGAVKLTPQELRNCIYRGTFNDALHKLADEQPFREAIGKPRDSRMRDEEMVLRFLALYADLPGYKPPLTQYLNEYMRINRQRRPKQASVTVFRDTMKTIQTIFGSEAFRMRQEGEVSANVNRALYDAVSLSLAYSDRAQARKARTKVLAGHRSLIVSDGFAPLVGRATADRTRMHGRVRLYSEMLASLGVKTSMPDLPEE
jgi:hypothetical protein